MNWNFPYASPRMPVLADACVATSHPLASQAGLAMLAQGGNAVDAIIAAAVALTVVEPTMNGIGGDAFAILWDGRMLHGLNASGRAPRAWTPERYKGRDAMPGTGWDSVTVPGAVSAWMELHAKFGKLPFEALFAPAIRHARDGYLVTPVIAGMWRAQGPTLAHFEDYARTFLPDGRPPEAGERFRCPDQAATLETIAASRGEAFYRGALADMIVAASKAAGGAMTLDDLGAHRADWVEPLGVDFKGYRIHELPPNGQGIAALIALGILDRIDIEGLEPDSVELQHLMIEATKLGLADLRAHVADPAAMRVRPEDLLTCAYLDERAKLIDRERATVPAPGNPKRSGTVYLAASDANGMMVSFIQSNYRGFGSGIVIPGAGIAMNDRGACFTLEAGHPNEVGGGKRPLQTIIPAFATKDGAPVAAFGVMGGVMQPQGHVQVGMRMFAKGLNPQAAVDAPRWRVEGGTVFIEAAWDQDFRDRLAARGHAWEVGPSLPFGASQVIWRLPSGGYLAASESRRDGQAVGL
jgi:gamma-glutamyltranspeptidase/glutathione hydrolase